MTRPALRVIQGGRRPLPPVRMPTVVERAFGILGDLRTMERRAPDPRLKDDLGAVAILVEMLIDDLGGWE